MPDYSGSFVLGRVAAKFGPATKKGSYLTDDCLQSLFRTSRLLYTLATTDARLLEIFVEISVTGGASANAPSVSHHNTHEFEKTTGLPFGNEVCRQQSCLHIYRNSGVYPNHFLHKISRHYLVGTYKGFPDRQETHTFAVRKNVRARILRKKKFLEKFSLNDQ
ncbi:MAG: hypothetical protein HDQ87_04500 [Clostridia bacterium]|nr:hypothetical protein [Clostridia bacterium]